MNSNQNIQTKKQIRNSRLTTLRSQIQSKLKTTKENSISDVGTCETLEQETSEPKTRLNTRFSLRSLSSEVNPFEPTQIFHSKYEILQKLGQGANGIVFKCLHKQSQQKYAVKKLSFEVQNLRPIKEYFQYVHQIDHPSIIKYKSLYISFRYKTAYIVMQLFEHSELQNYILNKQTEIRDITEKLLFAVQYLHKKGVCHRDIKPANLLYDPMDKQLKLIDFGVSKRIKIGRMCQQLLTGTGTLKYKAPEMFKGGVYSQLVDQWAVGITLYRLIAGITPFESEYISQTIQNIQQGQVKFQEPIWEKYSNQVKDLIQKLLMPSKQRITASQALKHMWFTNNLSSGRVSTLKRIGITPKQTMQSQPKNPTRKGLDNKFSFPGQIIPEEEYSSSQSPSPRKKGKKGQKDILISILKDVEHSQQPSGFYDSDDN